MEFKEDMSYVPRDYGLDEARHWVDRNAGRVHQALDSAARSAQYDKQRACLTSPKGVK